MRVAVIGSGIVGAAIAFHLARAGSDVVVLSAQEEGPATAASFAWINATAGNAPHYARFRMRAMAEWWEWTAKFQDLPARRSGALVWDLPEDELRSFLKDGLARGYPLAELDRDAVLNLEPALAQAPEYALHAALEGAAEPAATARWLLDAAMAAGATHRLATATGLYLSGGHVAGVDTTEGLIEANHAVIAAGVGSVPLAATADVRIPLRHAPGITIMTRPARRAVTSILIPPGLEVRQTPSGAYVVAGSLREGGGEQEAGERLHGRLAALLATDVPPIETIRIADRPMPVDGHPIAGLVADVPGLSVAVTHSGVTLAPLIGRLVAEEIRRGAPLPDLAYWSPARFADTAQQRMRSPAGS